MAPRGTGSQGSPATQGRSGSTGARSWQAEAWAAYDEVGEERFLASTLAGRLSQARLYVQHKPATGPRSSLRDGETDATDTAPSRTAALAEAVLAALGASQQDLGQMLQRLATNLFVAGEGWLVGVPRHVVEEVSPSGVPAVTAPSPDPALSDLVWRVLAVTEVSTVGSGSRIRLNLGTDGSAPVEVDPASVYMVRVWRPHPARYWEADSPTRACLPILRELIGLTRHISAQIDSRLAGAGILVVPSSASAALASDAADSSAYGAPDPFVAALMDSMLRPIENRDDASAVVPLVVTVPDEAADKMSHLTFSSALDSGARDLRDEAIRRLALAQDAPPELLLGSGAMNHWGAWLTREDTVTTHIEPVLALICDALTSQYLRPVLLSAGLSEDEARTLSVGYDVSALVARPNRSEEALNLHRAGAISDESLREASGFDDSDEKPLEERALMQALAMVTKRPDLMGTLGIGPLTDEILRAYRGDYSAPSEAVRALALPPQQPDPADGPASPDASAPDQDGPGRPPSGADAAEPGRVPGSEAPVSSGNARPESSTTPPIGA
uniref:Portal protein n=1 Tax=Dulem virus 38 TaxID=3145756 RepID=A0AAU8B0G3_9CAUD